MKVVAALSLVAVLSPAIAQAQTPAPPASAQVPPAQITISGWRLECDSLSGPLTCQVTDNVTARTNGAVISAISLRIDPLTKAPAMLVHVPLGIAVDDGVRVGFVNGAVQTLPVFTCNAGGCFARAALGTPVLAAMRAAKEPLHIAYDSLDAKAAKQTITISLALDGFASAYDRLR
jgi:invasion protein IalB